MSNAFDTTTDANAPVPFLDNMPREGSSMPGMPAKKDEPKKSLDDLTGGSDAQYDAITKADLKLTKEKIGAEGGMAAIQKRQDDAYAQRQERMLGAEGATMDDLKPWNAEKEMAKRETNLWEQFGSPGFVISMLASAFTAMPMNSALNAGAAAVNAINQGKMEDYHKAFDAWKENSNLTLKRLDIEEHEFNQIGDLRSKNMESWRAQATALATKYNDQRMLLMLQGGLDGPVMEAIDAKAKSKVELADARHRLLQNDIRMGLINADPDYKSGDPKKMAAAIHRADAAMQGDDASMTPDQRFQLMWHQQNPDGTYQEFSDAYGKFKRGERPDVSARYDEIARHNKAMEDVAAGRTTIAQAKQDEINRHNQNMEDIAAGRVATGYSREEEIERHNRAMEDLGSQKVDVSREAETGRNTRADLSNTTRLELNKLSTQARKEIEAAKLQVDAIKIDHQDRRTGAQIEGSYERAQLSDKTRREIAGMNNDARRELQEYLEGGRNKRASGNIITPEILKQWTDARGGQVPTPEMTAIIQSAYNTKGSIGGARIAQVGTALADIRDRTAKGEQLDDAAQEKILRAAVQQAPSGMTLDKDSADLIADQYLAGDRMAAAGFARSAQNMAMIRKAINEKAREQGLSGAEIAMKIAEFHGIVSAETATGRRTATIGMFANETKRVIEVAKRASKDVPRGEFIPFNQAMLSFERNTGDPKVVALGAALNAVINTYAKAINGGQQGTVNDKEHAREILELAYSDNQMDAVYNIMEQELQAAIDAPGDVKQGLRDLQSGKVKPGPSDPNVIKYDVNGNRVQ